MRKHAAVLTLSFLALALFAGFAGWAVFAASRLAGWGDLAAVWPYVLGGALAVAVFTVAFMWLAFYSADKGYDERADTEVR